jgi:hypothetical protein
MRLAAPSQDTPLNSIIVLDIMPKSDSPCLPNENSEVHCGFQRKMPAQFQKGPNNKQPVSFLRSKVPEGTNKYAFQQKESLDILN